MRKYTGDNLAVGFRIIMDALMPGGVTIEEIKEAALKREMLLRQRTVGTYANWDDQ